MMRLWLARALLTVAAQLAGLDRLEGHWVLHWGWIGVIGEKENPPRLLGAGGAGRLLAGTFAGG